MSVHTSRSTSQSDANRMATDDQSAPAREQWVSLAIAAATASLRASAPAADAPRRAEWDIDSA